MEGWPVGSGSFCFPMAALLPENLSTPRLLDKKTSSQEVNKPDSVLPANRKRCLFLWALVRTKAQAAYPEAVWALPWLPYLALHRIRLSWLPMSPLTPVVSYTTISPLRSTQMRPDRIQIAFQALFRYCAVCFCGAGSALLQLPVRKYPAQGVRTFLYARRHSRHLFLL